jgi:hypothetical protein
VQCGSQVCAARIIWIGDVGWVFVGTLLAFSVDFTTFELCKVGRCSSEEVVCEIISTVEGVIKDMSWSSFISLLAHLCRAVVEARLKHNNQNKWFYTRSSEKQWFIVLQSAIRCLELSKSTDTMMMAFVVPKCCNRPVVPPRGRNLTKVCTNIEARNTLLRRQLARSQSCTEAVRRVRGPTLDTQPVAD